MFTGWVDVGLTRRGEEQARHSGRRLCEADLLPSAVHTSLLSRAINIARLALEGAGRPGAPAHRTWRLNELHYGALQKVDRRGTRAVQRRAVPPVVAFPRQQTAADRARQSMGRRSGPALRHARSRPGPADGEPARRHGPPASPLARCDHPGPGRWRNRPGRRARQLPARLGPPPGPTVRRRGLDLAHPDRDAAALRPGNGDSTPPCAAVRTSTRLPRPERWQR